MKNKRIYISIIIIIFAFFLVVFFSFLFPNIKKEKMNLTIAVENNAILNFSNNKWSIITDKQLLNWKLFNIYTNGNQIGNYYLWWGDNRWHAFDSNKNSIKISGSLLAYNSNFNITVSSYEKKEVTDFRFVNKILEKYKINISKIPPSFKITVDINNDGIPEEFYAISNAFELDNNQDKSYSFAFMVMKDSIYMLYEDVRTNNYFDACKPYYSGFIDINEDNQYEVILSCGKYSIEEPLVILYNFVNGQFVKIISNE